jgi:hypothetical protein
MMEKVPRPAAPNEPNRAGDGRIPGQECRPPDSTVDPKILTNALQQCAVLLVGRRNESCLDRETLRSILKNAVRLDHVSARDQLIGPAALCAHWFDFTGRQGYLNHKYPVSRLQALITECFGLSREDIPIDAVFVGLEARCLPVEPIRNRRSPDNWAAAIRGRTRHPADLSRWVPLSTLGQRGVVPPIEIYYGSGAT